MRTPGIEPLLPTQSAGHFRIEFGANVRPDLTYREAGLVATLPEKGTRVGIPESSGPSVRVGQREAEEHSSRCNVEEIERLLGALEVHELSTKRLGLDKRSRARLSTVVARSHGAHLSFSCHVNVMEAPRVLRQFAREGLVAACSLPSGRHELKLPEDVAFIDVDERIIGRLEQEWGQGIENDAGRLGCDSLAGTQTSRTSAGTP